MGFTPQIWLISKVVKNNLRNMDLLLVGVAEFSFFNFFGVSDKKLLYVLMHGASSNSNPREILDYSCQTIKALNIDVDDLYPF